MTYRRLLSALIAALFSTMAVGAAEAQLWKPKKKAAVTAKKKAAPRKAARAKKPIRKKKATSSVVKFGPPPEAQIDPVAEDVARDRDEPGEPDDNPRISVYDGDRDE